MSAHDDSLERFLAGEDRLAALLRELPVFEVPASMTNEFSRLAHTAQRDYTALHVNAAVPIGSAPLSFEPPASLQAGFLAEAARIQAAQQPRHDVVIEQIQAGKPAAEVLGHDVTAATAAWLASRPARVTASERVAPQRIRHPWWPRLGLLAASVMVGGVATHLWRAQHEAQAPLVASIARSAESAPTGDTAPSLPPAVALQVEPIAQVSALSKRAPVGAGDSKQRVLERLRQYAENQRAESQRAVKTETLEPETEKLAADSTLRDQLQDRSKEERSRAIAPRRDEALAMAGATGNVKPSSESFAPAAPAAPASAMPAPVAAAPAPAARLAAGRTTLLVNLRNSPQELAGTWQSNSRGNVNGIFAAHPESEAVRNWVEHFREALPAEVRPARIKVEQDTRLDGGSLRLEVER